MPLHRKGKGWQYGKAKIYYGKSARAKALRQARAIKASQRRKRLHK